MSADVFILTQQDGTLFPPSVQATVLAKYSRSPMSAREIVASLTAEEAEKFHDKYTISYGHSSVAELAVIPLCFENVSMVASKFIEQFQRPGYSEKSTRYQKFTADNCVDPTGGVLLPHYELAFRAYEKCHQPMLMIAAMEFGLDASNPETLKLPKVKARAFDALRYLLPAGCATSLGAVMNMRDVRYLVQAARGSDNPEIMEIGEATFRAASSICPALIQRADPDDFEPKITQLHDDPTYPDPVNVVSYTLPTDQEFNIDVRQMYGMNEQQFDAHMAKRGARQVPSIFKRWHVEMDILMDWGAYRDLQRHRRCEQWAEPLTANFGYSMPDDVIGTELEPVFDQVFQAYEEKYEQLFEKHGHLAQYIVPMGFKHKSRFSMDLRELYYMVELRTKPQGHISYRNVAYEMYLAAKGRAPRAMKWCNAINPVTIGEHL